MRSPSSGLDLAGRLGVLFVWGREMGQLQAWFLVR